MAYKLLTPTLALCVAMCSQGATDSNLQNGNISLNEIQVKRLMASAHTADDYQTLANHFRAEEQEFQEKARKADLDYRQAVRVALPKGPGRTDRLKWIYNSNVTEAQSRASLADKYDLMASANGGQKSAGDAVSGGVQSAGAADSASNSERVLLQRIADLERQLQQMRK